MRSFVKKKTSRNGEITLSITDIGKSCTSRDFLAPQECLLTLFEKKFSRKFTVGCLSSFPLRTYGNRDPLNKF